MEAFYRGVMHTDWLPTGREEWAVDDRRVPGRGQRET